LKPLKRRDLTKELAAELNLSHDDVDEIIYHYYKYVGDLTRSLQYLKIDIPHLLSLNFRKKYSIRLIKELELSNETLSKKQNTDYAEIMINENNIKIAGLRRLLELHYHEMQEKNNKRKERYEYIYRDMESQKSNSGGNKE
jgi:hypothetical protein